ncbi:glycosyltransferase [Vibrio fluvialis]|nr:glycosyltransferase [Vibrio fluvialis]MBY8086911.1 glycosyltransferase [Vibrio fluvialis]MBY8103954.1 glycosyltransferase [Vibrio fluvialis]
MPLISVIIPSYNHSKFIVESIESVLCQENVDFELLIADDGSSDDTISVISKYQSNPKVTIFANKVNQGAGVVTDQLIRHSKGDYIALLNSDDFWEGKHKLSKQLNFLEENPSFGACFGKARFVDQNGKNINKFTMDFGDVFDKGKNRSRGEWLRYFLSNGNCLCHPTVLIRRECFNLLGTYKNSLRQLPDFEMWVNLLKHYDIHIFDEELVNFRILPGENASSNSNVNTIRTFNEHYLITKGYFESVSKEILIEGFSDLIQNPDKLLDINFLKCEVAFLLLNYDNRWLELVYKQVAIELLYELLNDNISHNILNEYYNFSDRDLYSLMGKIDCFRPDFMKVEQPVTNLIKLKMFLSRLKNRFF